MFNVYCSTILISLLYYYAFLYHLHEIKGYLIINEVISLLKEYSRNIPINTYTDKRTIFLETEGVRLSIVYCIWRHFLLQIKQLQNARCGQVLRNAI